jgi:hypothetical protein
MPAQTDTSTAKHAIADASAQVRETVSANPLTTLMVVGAGAFVLGALWKVGRRTPSRLERVRSQMPDLDALWRSLPKDYARYIPKEYMPRMFR